MITCVLNSEKYLAECLNSVNNQAYKNIEHLFIDGLSTDSTLKIIHQLSPTAPVYSGKDNGIYEAINRGLKLATGDIVGFLHSDDILADNQALERVAAAFERDRNLDFYCSRMLIGDESLNKFFAVLGAPPHRQKLREALYSSSYYAHPTYYCRRSVLEKVGLYDVKYKIAADIDWLIRLERLNLKWYFDDKILVKFRSSGKSLSSKRYFLALAEELAIRIKLEGLSFFLLTVYFYHFLRRGFRFVLEKTKLNFLIGFFRIIINFFKKT